MGALPRSGRTAVICACVLVCLASLAVIGAASSHDHVVIESASTQQEHGDVARFSVSLPEASNATLVVASENGSYRQRVRVTDASGDGEVKLRVNTYLGGRGADAGAVYSVAGDDRRTIGDGNRSRLDPGTYSVRAYGDTTTNGTHDDSATLRLVESERANATVMVGPAGVANRLTSRAAIERARDRGLLTQNGRAAINDTVVLRLDAPGIGGAFAAQSAPNQTGAFLSMLSAENVSLYAASRYPGGPHEPGTLLFLNDTEATTVVAEPRRDTYYVAIDTAAATVAWKEDEQRVDYEPELHSAGPMVPRFVVNGAHRLNSKQFHGDADLTAVFELQPRRASIDHRYPETVPLAPRANQTVRGTTTLAPASPLTVRLVTDTGTRLARGTARVSRRAGSTDWNSARRYRFNGTLDLTDVTFAGGASVEVVSNGRVLATREVRPVSGRASVELPETESLDDGSVRVPNATLPDGGFVAVRAGRDGRVLAATDYRERGTYANLSLNVTDADGEPPAYDGPLVAVAVRDSDGDGLYFQNVDLPYVAGGATARDSVELSPTETATASPTVPTTVAPTSTATDTAESTVSTIGGRTRSPSAESPAEQGEPTPSLTGVTSTERTAAGGPGFGLTVVVTAALALAVLALARTRRF